MESAKVLGILVTARDLERWRAWFAPPIQPFRTDLMSPELAAALPDRQVEPTPEWVDTFFMYAGTWKWLDEADFRGLRPRQQLTLLAVRRKTVRPKSMPAWPSELATTGDRLMLDWIASGAVRPSRHEDVPAGVWDRAAVLLPRARQLAGTFAPTGSGPNCFGAVMTAAGVADTENVQIVPDRFQTWIDQHTEPINGTSHDNEPGIIFLWTEHGDLAHATVTIGSGWMLTKPSQSWSSPRLIQTVRETVNSWRYPDTRLSRYRMLR